MPVRNYLDGKFPTRVVFIVLSGSGEALTLDRMSTTHSADTNIGPGDNPDKTDKYAAEYEAMYFGTTESLAESAAAWEKLTKQPISTLAWTLL